MRKSTSVRRLSIDAIGFGRVSKKHKAAKECGEAKNGETEEEGQKEEEEEEEEEEESHHEENVQVAPSPEVSFDMNDQQVQWNERAKYNLKPFLPHLARSRQLQTPLDNSLPLVLGSLHFYMAPPPPPLSRELLKELRTRILDDRLIVPSMTYDLLLEPNPEIYRALMVAICAMHKKRGDSQPDEEEEEEEGQDAETSDMQNVKNSINSIGQGEGLYYYYYCSSLGKSKPRGRYHKLQTIHADPSSSQQQQNDQDPVSAMDYRQPVGNHGKFSSGIGKRFSQSQHSMVRRIGAFL